MRKNEILENLAFAAEILIIKIYTVPGGIPYIMC